MGKLDKYFWTSSRCGQVLLLAAPFGFGPRVAAEAMSELLRLRLDSWKNGDRNANAKSTKLLLNFGVDSPPKVNDSAYRVWIDCLMWLRRALPKPIENYDLLLAESFFDTRDAFRDLPALRQISPLLTSSPPIGDNEKNKKHILVSFGGVETPFTEDVHRWLLPTLILEALTRSLRERNDSRKMVCCVPNRLRERLSRVPSFSTIRFLSPDHKNFLRLLADSSLYVVQPGLYGPFEGFERRIPTTFCTPFSYTQICQARKYEEHGLLGSVPLWDELNNQIGILDGQIETEESQCFAKLAKWLNERVTENGYLDVFQSWAEFLLSRTLISDSLTKKRASYAQSRKNLSSSFMNSFPRLHVYNEGESSCLL